MIGSFCDRIHDRIRDRERDGRARVGPGGRAAPGAPPRPRPAREEKKPNLSHFSRVQISTPCSTRQSNRQASEAKLGFHLGFTHMDIGHANRTATPPLSYNTMPREAGPEPHAWLLAQEPRDHPDDSTALSLSLRIRRRWPPAAFMPGMKAAARVGVVRIAQLSSRRYTPSRRADQRSGW